MSAAAQTAGLFPPSLADRPILAMATITALLFGTLMLTQWAQRLARATVRDSLPWRHPLTIQRSVVLLLLGAMIVQAIPRIVQVMCYASLSPDMRDYIAASSWSVTILWATIIGAAWLFSQRGDALVTFQLRRVPTPNMLAQLQGERPKAVRVLLMVMLIAFATTFIRAQPSHEPVANESPR
jgi:hypothetical protein